ncbi:MAG: ABC transporter substrate-binding protein [Promethearchaeota archaeon]
MKYKKNDVVIGVLAIVIVASGVVNIMLGLELDEGPIFGIWDPIPIVVGTLSPPHVLDPVNSWDSASNDVLEQVVETLFSYDLSDHMTPRIPLLAETYWWENSTTLHIKLKEGILFHDLTPFDANATKWNLDRILYFFNCTGTLPSTMTVGEPASLYYFSDGVTPIINSVVSDGAYNVIITLNAAFSPFLDLLCYTASAMLSPESTPVDEYISLTYGRVVGTGPFIYGHYIPNIEVRLYRFEYYWGGAPSIGSRSIDSVIMVFITDATTRNNAMLSHEIDWLKGFSSTLIPTFEADPTITVKYFTDDYGLPGLGYQYLGMNNEFIPTYWRRAISYAINYSFIIDEIMQGSAVRANSPISPSFGDAYNASITTAYYDLNIARQSLVDAGIAVGYPINSDPNDIYWLSNPLISLNYTYNFGNSFREDIYEALLTWLPAIGIQVVDDGITWSAYLRKLFEDQDELHLFWIGWGPDYKDPYDLLNDLFNPTLYSNSAQVNDSKLNTMMALALETTDDTARNTIYQNIQWYMANRLYPHCFGYYGKLTYVHSANLRGVYYNALDKFYAYPIYKV